MIVFFLIVASACSENIDVANLNRDLYAAYPVRFLHASVHQDSLHILMYRNTDSLSHDEWKQNAREIAHFIITKRNYNLNFRDIDFRYQKISAQVVITDTDAVTFHFNADSLRKIWPHS